MSVPPGKAPLYIVVREGIKVNLHVQPGGSRSSLAGIFNDRLKIRLAARAVEGEANRALYQFLSDQFLLPKSCISITHGLSSRDKTVLIKGDPQVLVKRLVDLTA